MNKQQYQEYLKIIAPKSPVVRNTIKAFLVGGAICTIGQGFYRWYLHLGMTIDNARMAVPATLIAVGAVLTALSVYDKIAKHAGAGTFIPITGFANAIVSPAMEFRTEGMVLGMSARLFIVAGPVLVYGYTASVIYGLLLWLL